MGIIVTNAAPSAAYVKLASGTLAAPAAAIDIQGIPSGYRHLQLRLSGKSNNATEHAVTLTINNDTVDGNYYAVRAVLSWEDGSSSTSNDRAVGWIDSAHPTYFSVDIDNKTGGPITYYSHGRGAQYQTAYGIYWVGVDVVNRLTLAIATGDSFIAGTEYVLYGLKV